MGCRSDYMDPTCRENESHLVCQLLTYLLAALNQTISVHIKDGSNCLYGNVDTLDNDTSLLCTIIQNLSPDQLDQLVFDGRNKNARRLADWWDKHQEFDRKRLVEEEEHRRQVLLKQQALAKLTPEEIKVLLH